MLIRLCTDQFQLLAPTDWPRTLSFVAFQATEGHVLFEIGRKKDPGKVDKQGDAGSKARSQAATQGKRGKFL